MGVSPPSPDYQYLARLAAIGRVVELSGQLQRALKKITPNCPKDAELVDLLKLHRPRFSNFEGITKARQLRNRLAHEDNSIELSELVSAQASFEKALEELRVWSETDRAGQSRPPTVETPPTVEPKKDMGATPPPPVEPKYRVYSVSVGDSPPSHPADANHPTRPTSTPPPPPPRSSSRAAEPPPRSDHGTSFASRPQKPSTSPNRATEEMRQKPPSKSFWSDPMHIWLALAFLSLIVTAILFPSAQEWAARVTTGPVVGPPGPMVQVPAAYSLDAAKQSPQIFQVYQASTRSDTEDYEIQLDARELWHELPMTLHAGDLITMEASGTVCGADGVCSSPDGILTVSGNKFGLLRGFEGSTDPHSYLNIGSSYHMAAKGGASLHLGVDIPESSISMATGGYRIHLLLTPVHAATPPPVETPSVTQTYTSPPAPLASDNPDQFPNSHHTPPAPKGLNFPKLPNGGFGPVNF